MNETDDNDYRGKRRYLPDDSFAIVEGAYEPGLDPMPQKQWNGLMNLPDDVVLRTADQQGSQLAQLYDLWGLWVETLPLQVNKKVSFMFDAALDAGDDFNAAVFTAAHGYYRQGMASLRSAIELMTISAGFAVRQDKKGLHRWLRGEVEAKFGNGRDFVAPKLGESLIEVLETIWEKLCKFNHAEIAATNGMIWRSDGPIWVPDAFTSFYITYRDVMALCYILLSIGWEDFQIPAKCGDLFDQSAGAFMRLESDLLAKWYN